jgi:acyl-ACP thioesterase
MNLIYETSLKITASDVDAINRLKLGRLFDYFQDAASNDAERRGFGYNDFVLRGFFWVLSWIKIEFNYLPKYMDEIKLQTWGKKQYKLYSLRDFTFSDSNDKIICKGTSAWLLLDSKSLRPKLLTQLYPNLSLLETKDGLSDLPQKMHPSAELEKVYAKTIRFSDIDLNQHTNNAKYVELMFDCFDQVFHKEHFVKTLTVSFNAQTRLNDEIELYKGFADSNTKLSHVEAKNIKNGNLVFQALIEWVKAE